MYVAIFEARKRIKNVINHLAPEIASTTIYTTKIEQNPFTADEM
jgi:hypothetical protein